MKRYLLITLISTLLCFIYYLHKTLIVLKTSNGFKIAMIGIYNKQELLNKNLSILFVKGVLKSNEKDIIILNPTLRGLKEISKGKVLAIAGPFYDMPSKFETIIQIKKT